MTTTVIRETPPLRTTTSLITPTGRRYRWAPDAYRPENVAAGERWSSTMPGGNENYDGALTRQLGTDYADLEPFTTIQKRDAAGDIIAEFRLERTPQSSGDRMAITPSAVGWQAHLDDDKSVRALFIDRDLSRWQAPSRARQVEAAAYSPFNGPSVSPDTTSGIAALRLDVSGEIASDALAETYYDTGPGGSAGQVAWDGADDKNLASGDYELTLWADPADHGAGTLVATYTDTGSHTVDLPALRWIEFALYHNATTSTDERWRQLRGLRVIGPDVPVTGTGDQQGVRASDVVALAVTRWAPQLRVTTDSIEPSGFVIPHLTFPDQTTVAEIIRQATRFGLQDWAVWEDRTFYWHSRGARGRTWRARIGPSQLQETGPQADRIWESAVVIYQDVDGSTRTVGPPGSGADTEDAVLKDTDPTNPANELGITRRVTLSMGVATPASAVEVGRRLLIEQRALDSSGSARFVGYVEDDRGVLHPYHHVRAGDTVMFVDAADPGPRRIVRAEHDAASRTCSVDLDVPPEGLAATLERLGVVITPFGL